MSIRPMPWRRPTRADNAFPASGTPLPMDVRTASVFSVRFVPVVQTNGLQGNVTNANKADFFMAAP